MIPEEITDSLSTFFEEQSSVPFRVLSDTPLSGGCINHVSRLKTSAGDFCLKYNRSISFPGMFESEARGLLLLKNSGEIRVPSVIHVCSGKQYAFLILEFISSGSPAPGMMSDFGRSLARLHSHTAEMFGEDRDNYMGSLSQSNRKHEDWVSFFIEERLEKQVQLALSAGYFSNETLAHFHKLYQQLDNIFPGEKPALLHGDLWGGNYLMSETGNACLIDPAVYYGNREIDIAMTTLFGGFDNTFYSGYNEIFPLEKGWRQRIDICNLYPLLIHLNLFGHVYLGQIESIVRKY